MKKSELLFFCFLAGGLVLGWTSCQRQKGLPQEALDRPQSFLLQEVALDGMEPVSSDPFELVEATVEGDALNVLLMFGGGCAEHEFTLVESAPMVRSMPPKRLLTIQHNGHGDQCRALIQEERTFDLTPYRGSPQGLTILMLDTLRLTYRY